jgi:hypothetical protein
MGAGDPNNAVRFNDDATAEELRAEMVRRIAEMRDAAVIDLAALLLTTVVVSQLPDLVLGFFV